MAALIFGNTLERGGLFLAVLGVDSLDLVADQLDFVLQLLYLAVHLVDERVALLYRSRGRPHDPFTL